LFTVRCKGGCKTISAIQPSPRRQTNPCNRLCAGACIALVVLLSSVTSLVTLAAVAWPAHPGASYLVQVVAKGFSAGEVLVDTALGLACDSCGIGGKGFLLWRRLFVAYFRWADFSHLNFLSFFLRRHRLFHGAKRNLASSPSPSAASRLYQSGSYRRSLNGPSVVRDARPKFQCDIGTSCTPRWASTFIASLALA